MKIILGVKLYDYEEVGKMLGVGKRTITAYTKGAGIEGTKIERKLYLNEEQIKTIITPRPKKKRPSRAVYSVPEDMTQYKPKKI